ncbi:molybdate ABC transporter substrate-binding protein [Paenibacillus roseipurpureus]|uniref:Molybdate ABC transporter substrate-binding protein n=1 Tax=Paenibacillus roseopurpureus TaxID=2918901 RepID=A0AA96LRZ7_9BACL|nr:molybdate ABC transporter substrate-binding protein [Paenibacillus sp. MBLB1832]WNR46208.1 molybdate ABC transporter substrate-binding protein [Paenibacillus sp. MBLB1832]
MFRLSKISYHLSYFVLAALVITGCAKAETSAEKIELTISAAASLTDALKEIQTNYENKNKSIKINFNFGASGALQQQIEQGAPADLFFSAATKNMKALVDKQLIDSAQQKNLLVNELVAVVPADGKVSVQKAEDLNNDAIKHLAVGEPQTVPAGSYAKEALTNVKLWDTLQAKIVQGKDVRQVLTYVESGNAEAGFVYKTDALTSKSVKVAFSVDPKTYTPIQYPAGIVKATKHSKETLDFFTYLQSKDAQDVFVKYGFTIPQ